MIGHLHVLVWFIKNYRINQKIIGLSPRMHSLRLAGIVQSVLKRSEVRHLLLVRSSGNSLCSSLSDAMPLHQRQRSLAKKEAMWVVRSSTLCRVPIGTRVNILLR
jgi:hypothetical protein